MLYHRRNSSALLAALLLCSLSSTLPLPAQDWRGRGRVQGVVTDQDQHPVEGATVTLRKGNDPVKAEGPGPTPLKTDKKGRWSMLGLAHGAWGVLIEKQGYIPSEGRINVEEEGLVPPILISLKPIPKEQAQQEQAPSKGSQALAAITDGNAALQADKLVEAREAYEKALALLDPPNQVPVLRAIASTYYRESGQVKTKDEKAQKLEKSIATLKQALEIKPDDTESLQLIVNLLVGAGREAEAQTYMAKLPQGAKVDADTLINVGIKYYNQKQLDKALEQFNRVVAENPEMAEAYYYRGLVYLNKNKVPEAKADFKKLLEIDPKSKYANEVREYLKAL
ncbi:MAG TPA: tetratricopeptide repeat protein [Thermoanaerobaculia bacterium]|jgi:tetratricopeptide (TPR) repeat protein|nr:tetratricopeptide repeat protein [Thermoanaerobaculia bacterium]